MPSYRYTRDIKPEESHPEQPKQYTKKEKAANWWHYSKVWVFAALIGLALLGSFIYSMASKPNPDFSVGILTPYPVPPELVDKLEQQLTGLVQDVNGDGKIQVSVETFEINLDSASEETDPYQYMAGITRLTGALSTGSPVVFIVQPDQLDNYQQQFELFSYPDGTQILTRQDMEKATTLFKDIPAFAGLDLTFPIFDGPEVDAQGLLADFVVGVRGYQSQENGKPSKKEKRWKRELEEYLRLLSLPG